ncbi:DUF418 domain-containing protein [Sphingomonas sp. MMS12-HWE2-04]|uniref:DUF418 domain-containing protein n=1 Tax=Sphingomonas sp. MMS12-HWE2-04 TaxID=3234199 RepID=UPI00385147BF
MTDAQAAPAAPIISNAASRLQSVDIIRGFALMALFLVHMVESYELYWSKPDGGIAVDTVFALFMGKSFSLLALCFGFSFFILMDRAAKRGSDFSARFAWRLLVLEGIGFVHSLIYRGDIIQLLAGLGFLLLIAHRVKSNRALIVAAIVCFLGPTVLIQLLAADAGAAWANQPARSGWDPAMQAYLHGSLGDHLRANLWQGQIPKWWFMLESGRLTQIFGLYLVGMVLGRIGFFARLEEFAKARWIGLGVAAMVVGVFHYARPIVFGWFAARGHSDDVNRLFDSMLSSWFELAATFGWALVLLNLYQSPARRLLMPLAAAGRATLTLYILQSLIFVPVFYTFGLGLYDDWDGTTRLWVGLAAIAAQLAIANLWFRRFQYGPIEWVWRSLTFLRRDIPFRRVA